MNEQTPLLGSNLGFEQKRFNAEHNHDGINSAKLANVSANGIVNTAIGNATAPASPSTVTINCGFRPKLIKITSQLTDASHSTLCIGACTLMSDEHAVVSYWDGSKMVTSNSTSFIILVLDTSGSSVCAANISAISDTGFSLYFMDTTVRPFYTWEAIG